MMNPGCWQHWFRRHPGGGLAGRRSASRDPGAHRVGVDACDAGAVVAGGSWIFLRDREDRLDALRKREDDAVRGRERGDGAELGDALLSAAVRLGAAWTEAVPLRVRLTQLRALHRDHLVRARDPL